MNGPVVQSIGIGFKAVYAAIAVLAALWVASNWRQVPADSQAVVLRFGRITGVQQAGLTMSWPRPIGNVVLVPGAERLLTLRTATTARTGGLVDIYTAANGAAIPEGSGSYLTGDGGAVLLAAAITYQVSDGAAYYLSQTHVDPALQRLFDASAVRVAATRDLDDVLVARPDKTESDPARAAATEARRQQMRGDLVREMNRRLAALAAEGASLGVTVSRIDLDTYLPPAAKIAFDGVLVAVQLAEQGIAGARTEATRTRQAADRERDLILTAAHASAEERIGAAQAGTAAVTALQASMTPATRSAVLDQYYRDQLALLLHKVGRVTAVDGAGGARVILPATPPVAGNSP
jgi:regulator of protease activity HflC (stomatin/prohibitin superfamily)